MDVERRLRRQSWLTLLGHGLLSLVLLLGAVDAHPRETTHEPLGPASESIYHPGASHRGQPVHVEEADPVQRPHCAACLLRLETRGAYVQPVSSALPAELTFYLWFAPDPRASRIALSPSGARAPPLS